MKKLMFVLVLINFCHTSFGMVYPVGNPSIKPTANFNSGNGYVVTQEFNNSSGHTGVDLANNASGGDVRSIAAGVVTYIQNSQTTSGWGTMLRIRHQLLDGTTYYSQYAHLMYDSIGVTENTLVNEGQLIGRVGNTGFSTGAHLHFEVKKDAMDTNGCGYLPSINCPNDLMDNYYNPLEFISQSGSSDIVGRYPDGSIHIYILNCYNEAGGEEEIGWPTDNNEGGIYVHEWYSVDGTQWITIQDFKNAAGEHVAIIVNGSEAFVLKGAIRWTYMRHNDPVKYFGPPTMDEAWCRWYPWVNGQFNYSQPMETIYRYQEFQNGRILFWNQGSEAYLYDIPRGGGGFEPALLFDGPLVLEGQSVSSSQVVLEWTGGEMADYYSVLRDGIEVGVTVLPEFSEVHLSAGTTYRYQVLAFSNTTGEIDSSNEIVVIMPGTVGSFLLTGVAESSDAIYLEWQNTAHQTQFYWIYRNGAKIAETTSSSYSDFPLQSDTAYWYQIAAVTLSEITLGVSNEITVATDHQELPPNDTNPIPTRVVLHVDRNVWEFRSDGFLLATVYDQYENEMFDETVVYLSTNHQVVVVDPDDGYAYANSLGQAEVWAEVQSMRNVKSDRISITVIEPTAEEDPEPGEFPSAIPVLGQPIEIVSSSPYLVNQLFTWRVTLHNTTNQTASFYGPAVMFYDSYGRVVFASSYMSAPKTLLPGAEIAEALTAQFPSEPGRYYLRAHIKEIGADDWSVVDESFDDIETSLWFNVITQQDLRAELEFFSSGIHTQELQHGDPLLVQVSVINSGDISITSSFRIEMSIPGIGSRHLTVQSLGQGLPFSHTFDFGQAQAGQYAVTASIDTANTVAEYNENNNTMTQVVLVSQPSQEEQEEEDDTKPPEDPCASASPSLSPIVIPAMGDSRGVLQVRVNGICDYGNYRVAVWSNVNVGSLDVEAWQHWIWVSKPSASNPFVTIGDNGIAEIITVQDGAEGRDRLARAFFVALVPVGAIVPIEDGNQPQRTVQPSVESAVATLFVERQNEDSDNCSDEIPVITLTRVSGLGDSAGLLELMISGVCEPASYQIAVWANVNVGSLDVQEWEHWIWVSKPTAQQPLVVIGQEGAVAINTVQDGQTGRDRLARAYFVALVPVGSSVPAEDGNQPQRQAQPEVPSAVATLLIERN